MGNEFRNMQASLVVWLPSLDVQHGPAAEQLNEVVEIAQCLMDRERLGEDARLIAVVDDAPASNEKAVPST